VRRGAEGGRGAGAQVDANMAEAHKRNAAVEGKFWFRRHMAQGGEEGRTAGEADACQLMTIHEILTGFSSLPPSPRPAAP
jgi:hypothetical protein